MSVKSSIKSITKSLESIQDDRTYLIKHTRDAVSLCSQSIIAVHGQDLPTAKKKAAEASRLVKKYRPKAVGSLSKYLFKDAMAVIAIAEKKLSMHPSIRWLANIQRPSMAVMRSSSKYVTEWIWKIILVTI